MRRDQNMQLMTPSPPGMEPWSYTGKPPIIIRRDLERYTKSGRLRPDTHIKQHIHSCRGHPGEYQRKILFKTVRGTGTLWSALTERDCTSLGGRAQEELALGLVLQ